MKEDNNRWASNVGPIGLICCFGLLLFLIAASIVLALIPVYLPSHTSGLQSASTQTQVVYIEYSGTAANRVTGSVSNLAAVNQGLNSQLSLQNNVLTVTNVQVINKPNSRRRRYSNNPLEREKRQIFSFLVLFTVEIIFHPMCRSDLCHRKFLGELQTRCAERATIILDFIFISYTNGPIQFNLVFITFTLIFPPIFIESGQSSTQTAAITAAITATTAEITAEITEAITAKTAAITATTAAITATTTASSTEQTGTSNLIIETDTGGECDQAVIQGLKLLGSYNLITIGNLSTTTNVANRTLVCGSITSSSSATFASNANPPSPSNYTLEVNGQIVGGGSLNIIAGSFGVGTNPSHTIVQTSSSPVQYTLDGRQVNIEAGNSGATLNVDTNLANTCQSVTTSLQQFSQILSTFSNTSENTVTIPTSQAGPVNLNVNAVNSNGISVFNLNGNQLLNNNLVQQIQLNVASSINSSLQLVVINLSGKSISFDQGNLVGNWFTSQTGQSQTIWNLPQATTLTITQFWMGTLLAPNAQVTDSTQINGAVAVYSLTTTGLVNNPSIALPSCV